MNATINMFDHALNQYVRIKRTAKGWERWVSKSKKHWKMTHKAKSMDDVLRFKEEVVNNNYRNLYGLILKK
jgi:hypothetical protein